MKSSLLALSWLMVIATLLPLSSGDAWWIRAFDFPRVQITVIALGLLLAILFVLAPLTLLEYLTAAALLASIGLQTWRIFPYTPFAPIQVQATRDPDSRSTFELFVANVLMDNRNVAGLKEQFEAVDPDAILLVEIDSWWKEQLTLLERDYPYVVAYPLDNTYGMVLYSRLPLIDPQIRFLVLPDVPSIHTRVQLRSGIEIELHCIHPKPPSPSENPRATERDAELVLVGKAVKNANSPIIVAGDLNDVGWSHTTGLFQKASGLLDPRIGRGIFGTFPARYPLLRWPLDHVFHSTDFKLMEIRTLDYYGSDHLPVFIALNYQPAAKVTQDEPDDPDRAEQEEMQDTIDKATTGEPVQY